MKIVWHIVLKDLRHFWIEVSVFLASVVAWTSQQAYPDAWHWSDAKDVLPVVMITAWIVLAIRLIQGEPIVGDREFWQTRPYRWGYLLAAKIIPLILILNGSILAAQVYLIARVEIPLNVALVPGLLWLQLEFFVFMTLPAVVLGVITESFVQALLTVGGTVIFVAVASFLPGGSQPDLLRGADQLDTLLEVIIAGLCCCAIVTIQYARRRVRLARVVAGGIVFFAIAMNGIRDGSMMRSLAYPVRDASEFQVSILPESESGKREYIDIGVFTGPSNADGFVQIPLAISTFPKDTLIEVDGSRVTLTGDGGWHFQSNWSSRYDTLTKIEPMRDVSFEIPNSMAREIESRHAKLHLELALEIYALETKHIQTSAGRFDLPGLAFCDWDSKDRPHFVDSTATCANALRFPDVMLLDIHSDDDTCGPVKDEPLLPPSHTARHWNWERETGPAEFDLNPVHVFHLTTTTWDPPIPSAKDPKNWRTAAFCKGMPLTVQIGKRIRYAHVAFELGSVGSLKPKPPNEVKE